MHVSALSCDVSVLIVTLKPDSIKNVKKRDAFSFIEIVVCISLCWKLNFITL